MFPRSVICDRCGAAAIVVAWVPTELIINKTTGANESQANVMKCRIQCEDCGTRIQAIIRDKSS